MRMRPPAKQRRIRFRKDKLREGWIEWINAKVALRRRLLLDVGGTNSAWGEDYNRPDTWTLNRTWDLGGVIDGSDLTSITTNDTTKRINCFDVDPTGTYVMSGNTTDDTVRSYILGTPWDFSSASYNIGQGRTNPTHCKWMNMVDGVGWAVFLSSADDIESHFQTTDFSLWSVDETLVTATDDALLGNTTTQSSPFCFNADGSALYIGIAKSGGVNWLRRFELSTAYDVATYGSYTEKNIDTDFANLSASSGGMVVSEDEAFLILFDNGEFFLGAMSTPADASTITFDMVNGADTVNFDGHIVVNPEYTKAYVVDNTSGSPEIQEYDIPDS